VNSGWKGLTHVQERYLGDSHDFLKYAFLRHLKNYLNLKLGVNWDLTRSDHVDRVGNNDGEKRHHLEGKGWQQSDPDLFEKIQIFEYPANRRIENIAARGLLPPCTSYHAELLSGIDRHIWHRQAMTQLQDSDLIFLDPDNGFEINSMTRRTRPKYAFYAEAADYYRAGKIVVGIQFARQCAPIARAQQVRSTLAAACGSTADIPVVRGRVSPNILFVSVAPPPQKAMLLSAINSFADRCQKIEIVP